MRRKYLFSHQKNFLPPKVEEANVKDKQKF